MPEQYRVSPEDEPCMTTENRFVTVVDYGMGNLFSVCRALEHCGATPVLTDTPEGIAEAERLILPGVGAFADGMAGLEERGMVASLQAYAMSHRPLLGICLGMQMLLDTNDEFGLHRGLGLIPGHVAAIPPVGTNHQAHKIPHIGWNTLVRPHPDTLWDHTLLDNIPQETPVYFVHSFTAVPAEERYRLADCDYHGQRISAVIRSENLYGCQFHPEKSGPMGLRMINRFIQL
jgi:glutamine amidotransferase